MGNQKSLLHQNKSLKEIVNNIDKSEDVIDPCPTCNTDLYFDDTASKRCAIIDAKNTIVGWLCPNCKSEFEGDDTLVDIFTNQEIKGKA